MSADNSGKLKHEDCGGHIEQNNRTETGDSDEDLTYGTVYYCTSCNERVHPTEVIPEDVSEST